MAYQVDTLFVWGSDLTEASGWYSQFGIEAGPRYGSWQTMIVDGDTHFALHEGARREGPLTGARVGRVDKVITVVVEPVITLSILRRIVWIVRVWIIMMQLKTYILVS